MCYYLAFVINPGYKEVYTGKKASLNVFTFDLKSFKISILTFNADLNFLYTDLPTIIYNKFYLYDWIIHDILIWHHQT